MILKTLTLVNFMRFAGTNVIEFDGKQIVGIVAEWDDEPTRSNQSGKSCIIDALTYLLWGKTRAKTDSSLLCRHTPNADYEVSGTFVRSDGKEVFIRRGREKRKPVLDVEIAGDSGGDNESIIEELGMTYDEFILGPCFIQGRANSFMDSSPSVKAEMILKYLQSYRWDEAHQSAKDELSDCRDSVTKLRGSLDVLRGHQGVDDAQDEHDVALESLRDCRTTLKRLKKRRDELSSVLDDIKKRDDVADQLDDARGDVEALEKRIDSLRRKNSELKAARKELKKLRGSFGDIGEALIRVDSSKDQLDDSLVNVRTALRTNKTRLDVFEDMSGVCPVLAEPCDRVEPDQDEIDRLTDEIDSLDERVAEILVSKSEFSDEARRLSSTRRKISGLKATVRSIDVSQLPDLKDSLKATKSKIGELKKTLKKLNSGISNEAHDELSDIDAEVEEAEELKEDLIEEVGRTQALVDSAKLAVKRTADIEHELATQEKNLMMWNYIVRMFSRAGIPSHELEQAFTMLEDEINHVLTELDAGTTAVMSSFRELKKWEDVCVGCGVEWKLKNARQQRCTICGAKRMKKRREEFTLSFEDDKANQDDFHLDSGGGKILKSIGVRIALSLLKMRSIPDPLSMLILDEVFGELDEVNQEKVLQVVTSIALKLGFEQVFIISHTSIKDSFQDTLLVTRKEYYSEASWR